MRTQLLLMAILAAPCATSAQKASEKALVMQQVAGVDITVEYHRPVARGRDKLFGGVVHWNEVWTPGANNATTLEVSADVTLNGQLVPKGKYSLWMIPSDTGSWTVFLNKNAKRWHTQKPKDTSEDVVRFLVKPTSAPAIDVLTFAFPAVTKEGATLQMQWGETVVPLELRLSTISPVKLTPELRRMFAGEYRAIITNDLNGKQDTTVIRIVEKGETLRMLWGRSAGSDDFYQEVWLLDHEKFVQPYFNKGQLSSLDRARTGKFIIEGGKAIGFILMNRDQKTGEATRTN